MIRKNFFSILTALLILYLSLSEADTFDKMSFLEIPGLDKIVHTAMYFFLMSVIIAEKRLYRFKFPQIFRYTLIPLLYGLSIELLQLLLTSTRSASIADALFNAAGIFAAVFLAGFFLRRMKTDS
jgi:VanZ family protein